MNQNQIVKTFQFGQHEVKLEAGRIAKQAQGSVIASMGDTIIMATAVGQPDSEPKSFFAAYNRLRRTYLRRRQNPGWIF